MILLQCPSCKKEIVSEQPIPKCSRCGRMGMRIVNNNYQKPRIPSAEEFLFNNADFRKFMEQVENTEITLTPQQIENWKIVMISIYGASMYFASDKQVQWYHDKVQRDIDTELGEK